MTRLVPLTLAVLLSISASAQTNEVSPLAEASVLAERSQPALTERAVRAAGSPTMTRLAIGEIIDPAVVRPRSMVSFEVRGFVASDGSDVLLDLSQADALRTLSASSTLSGSETVPQGTAVEATFRFASVAQWAAWRALPETQALLSRLDNGAIGLQTQFDAVVLD